MTPQETLSIRRQLKPQPVRSFRSVLEHDPYNDMPITYVRCAKDNVIPPEFQDALIDIAGGREKVNVVELDSSHSPMLSMPKKCAEIIAKAAMDAVAA